MNKHTMKKISAAVFLTVTAIAANASDQSLDAQENRHDAVPKFHKIKVHGTVGHGITHKLLRSKGADMNATDDDHDSQLIDASVMTHEEATAAIVSALENKKTIIVDGDDTLDSSKKLGKIMDEAVGFSVDSVTAYMVKKAADGATTVTPLQSLNTKKGVRKIDQLHNVLNPRHQ